MKLRGLLLAAMLCTLCIGQASALEYTMDAPDDYLFARPTSDDTIYDLMGRKVAHPIKGSLYIKGGKKYIHR